MEVRQHRFDHFEFETYFGIWVDKEIGRGWAGGDCSSTAADCVFESSNRCGSDGDDATSAAESPVDGVGGVRGDGIGFGMEFVIFDLLGVDWLEGSEADLECDFGGLDAALVDSIEDFRSEMQAGGRGCYRSRRLGIDGLIAFAIAGRIGAGDVGRERDVADAIESGEEVVHGLNGLEADMAFAELGAGQDLGLQLILIAEEEALADTDFAARANQAFPINGIRGELAGEKDFDAAPSAFAASVETGGKDASVVEDQEIAGVQKVGEVAEQAIGIFAAGSLQMQQAGSVAGGEGFLGDEFGGKVEVEIGNPHGVRL
jgi:hypothetical protein